MQINNNVLWMRLSCFQLLLITLYQYIFVIIVRTMLKILYFENIILIIYFLLFFHFNQISTICNAFLNETLELYVVTHSFFIYLI